MALSLSLATHAPSTALGLVDRALLAAVAGGRQAFRAWQLRRDHAALASLDDAALADIGLGRGEVEAALRYGRPGLAALSAPTPVAPLMPASWTEWR